MTHLSLSLCYLPREPCEVHVGNKVRAFSDEVDTGSSQKMRLNNKLERRSESMGSECALALPVSFNSVFAVSSWLNGILLFKLRSIICIVNTY